MNTFHQLCCELFVCLQLIFQFICVKLIHVNTYFHQIKFQLETQNFMTFKVFFVLTVFFKSRKHAH